MDQSPFSRGRCLCAGGRIFGSEVVLAAWEDGGNAVLQVGGRTRTP